MARFFFCWRAFFSVDFSAAWVSVSFRGVTCDRFEYCQSEASAVLWTKLTGTQILRMQHSDEMFHGPLPSPLLVLLLLLVLLFFFYFRHRKEEEEKQREILQAEMRKVRGTNVNGVNIAVRRLLSRYFCRPVERYTQITQALIRSIIDRSLQ